MRNAIEVTLPFMAPVGTVGVVRLIHNRQCADKAHLSIDVGHIIKGSSAAAHLSVDRMRQLVDALMDCIQALERQARLNPGSHHG